MISEIILTLKIATIIKTTIATIATLINNK